MASVKEIKGRIGSIQDTMKITNAMYMISSSKMTKAKKTLEQTEPFFFEQRAAVAKMMQVVPEYNSPFFGREDKAQEDKIRGYVVITGDKGLAGAYNHNVLKLAAEDADQHRNTRLYSIGETGRHFFENKGYNLDADFRYTVQDPSLYRARNISTKLVTDYLEGEVDEIYVVYTKMENAFCMNAEMFRLLPVDKEDLQEGVREEAPDSKYSAVTNFHPSVNEVMDNLIPNIVAGSIYGALVESYASEHNSRMMAMQNATDNAKEILRELGISFNRARQAAITQEITEVVAGAKAQKNKKN